jgi:Mn-dependent DtxR family transcriptional regulator
MKGTAMKTVSDAVLINMNPLTFYRARDVAEEMDVPSSTVSAALRELARGG